MSMHKVIAHRTAQHMSKETVQWLNELCSFFKDVLPVNTADIRDEHIDIVRDLIDRIPEDAILLPDKPQHVFPYLDLKKAFGNSRARNITPEKLKEILTLYLHSLRVRDMNPRTEQNVKAACEVFYEMVPEDLATIELYLENISNSCGWQLANTEGLTVTSAEKLRDFMHQVKRRLQECRNGSAELSRIVEEKSYIGVLFPRARARIVLPNMTASRLSAVTAEYLTPEHPTTLSMPIDQGRTWNATRFIDALTTMTYAMICAMIKEQVLSVTLNERYISRDRKLEICDYVFGSGENSMDPQNIALYAHMSPDILNSNARHQARHLLSIGRFRQFMDHRNDLSPFVDREHYKEIGRFFTLAPVPVQKNRKKEKVLALGLSGALLAGGGYTVSDTEVFSSRHALSTAEITKDPGQNVPLDIALHAPRTLEGITDHYTLYMAYRAISNKGAKWAPSQEEAARFFAHDELTFRFEDQFELWELMENVNKEHNEDIFSPQEIEMAKLTTLNKNIAQWNILNILVLIETRDTEKSMASKKDLLNWTDKIMREARKIDHRLSPKAKLDRVYALLSSTWEIPFSSTTNLIEGLGSRTFQSLDCDTNSLIYLAIASELGWPVTMINTVGHTFIRWVSGAQDHFNYETTNGCIMEDDHYRKNDLSSDHELSIQDTVLTDRGVRIVLAHSFHFADAADAPDLKHRNIDKAMELDPTNPQVMAIYVSQHPEMDLEEAENIYRTALELQPHDPCILSSYALFLNNNGRFPEAVAFIRKAVTNQHILVETAPDSTREQEKEALAQYYRFHAHFLENIGDRTDPETCARTVVLYQKALNLTAASNIYERAATENVIFSCYFYMKDYRKALDHINRALSYDPYNSAYWGNKVTLMKNMDGETSGGKEEMISEKLKGTGETPSLWGKISRTIGKLF